jgi:hypothetical protein
MATLGVASRAAHMARPTLRPRTAPVARVAGGRAFNNMKVSLEQPAASRTAPPSFEV